MSAAGTETGSAMPAMGVSCWAEFAREGRPIEGSEDPQGCHAKILGERFVSGLGCRDGENTFRGSAKRKGISVVISPSTITGFFLYDLVGIRNRV